MIDNRIDDRHAFFYDAGNLALDLLNTLGVERSAKGAPGTPDLLGKPSDLTDWLGGAGPWTANRLEAVEHDLPAARLMLAEALHLRAAIRDAVRAMMDGASLPASSLFVLNRVLASASSSRWLDTVDGRVRVRVREDTSAPLSILAPIALAAAELLESGDPARLRRCSDGRCRSWFLDTSKGGRRRWCSMARCGNRAKAARHRAKAPKQ